MQKNTFKRNKQGDYFIRKFNNMRSLGSIILIEGAFVLHVSNYFFQNSSWS